ncbi:MAG: hypothetical protein ACR2RF_24090 [Geminicoccaceae bacterium]
MKYSARQVANLIGVETSTITRHIEKGKLSAAKNDQNNWEIEASEIARAYADLITVDLHGNITKGIALQSETNANDINHLQMKVAFLEKRLVDRERDLEKAEQAADRMHELFRDTVLRLEPPKTRGWLSRLFGS